MLKAVMSWAALHDLPDRTGPSLKVGHEMNLQGRNLLKETDLTAGEFLDLVELGGRLRLQKRMGLRCSRLAGRDIALIFEKTSTDPVRRSRWPRTTRAPTSPTSGRRTPGSAA